MATNLNLRLHSVKCVDETGGSWAERVGNDEIYLGGFIIIPGGETKKVSPLSIYPHFDDGDIKRFDPPRVFTSFNLQSGINYPSNCVAGLLLFEKDSGDMTSATEKVYQKVLEEVEKKKNAMAADAVGSPQPDQPQTDWIGIIWSAVKLVVYNYVKTKIAGAFADEAFPLQEASVTLLSPNHTWNGSNVSPVSMVEFRGHDGIYQLFYDWELT